MGETTRFDASIYEKAKKSITSSQESKIITPALDEIAKDKNQELLYKDFKEWKTLTPEQQVSLSESLIKYAESRPWYNNVDLYIDASKLNPSKLSIAQNYILENVSNSGWSKDVLINLEKIGVSNDAAKTLILEETNKILAQYKEENIPSLISIRAAMVACKSSGIELQPFQDKITQMKNTWDDNYRDLELATIYWDLDHTTSNRFITQFKSTNNNSLIQFYNKDNQNIITIPSDLNRKELIEWEKKQFEIFSKKMEDHHAKKLLSQLN